MKFYPENKADVEAIERDVQIVASDFLGSPRIRQWNADGGRLARYVIWFMADNYGAWDDSIEAADFIDEVVDLVLKEFRRAEHIVHHKLSSAQKEALWFHANPVVPKRDVHPENELAFLHKKTAQALVNHGLGEGPYHAYMANWKVKLNAFGMLVAHLVPEPEES